MASKQRSRPLSYRLKWVLEILVIAVIYYGAARLGAFFANLAVFITNQSIDFLKITFVSSLIGIWNALESVRQLGLYWLVVNEPPPMRKGT